MDGRFRAGRAGRRRGDRTLGHARDPLPGTATRDVEIGGQPIRAGDKVVLWYNSANRDQAFWPDPYRFDVTRAPNDHVGFGAGGPHFCLGANLARREIRVMFEELLRRLPDIHVTGAPDMLQSAFIHGIKRVRVEFTPAR